ncbi:MAG: amidase [Proteobacteria bacterium]|nr:amidase [Pseudomonadota bacterium]
MTGANTNDDPLGAFCPGPRLRIGGAPGGPLTGLTFTAKDSFDVAGHRTGNGHPVWLTTHEPAAETAWPVQCLLDAGADLDGKTQCDEIQYSLNGENDHYGTPRNPAAPDRVPGGSSSGSVSAVAGGAVDFGLAVDCGGSVRIPASYCGVLGLRPTHGRISGHGCVALAPSFDTIGWFARDSGLFERVGRVLLGDDSEARPPGRIIIAEDAFALAGDEVRSALDDAVNAVRALAGQVSAAQLAPDGFEPRLNAFRILQGAEIWAQHGEWVTEHQPDFGPGVRERFEMAARIGTDEVAGARRARDEAIQHTRRLLGDDALICLPAAAGAAPRLAAPAEEVDQFRSRALSLLSTAGLCSLPQISLPLGTIEGCPLGLSLIAPPNRDVDLLAVARALMPGK